jgi:hypothetical protein
MGIIRLKQVDARDDAGEKTALVNHYQGADILLSHQVGGL